MDLKEFVSKALVDIMDGVADAQRKVSGGQIVPEFDITLTDSRGQAVPCYLPRCQP
jgi:hypothetical protein